MKKRLVLLFLPLIFVSCLSFNRTVSRWPDRRNDEQISRSLPCEKKTDIFTGFGWTTPPIRSREVQDQFIFSDREYTFSLTEGIMHLQWDDRSMEISAESSRGIYPDMSFLTPVNEIQYQWVPKTYHRMESVPVTKSRSVPVTTIGANGMASTTFRTEFYTDWEFHTVVETRMEWEARSVRTYRFPELEYFNISLEDGTHFYLYHLVSENSEKFLLQNPEYYQSVESNKNIWGTDREMNLLFIDSNANGTYMDEEDHVLFNVWNPFDENSVYTSVNSIKDNYWYPVPIMRDDRFLKFSVEQNYLNIHYLNEEFMGSENTGKLIFTGLDEMEEAIFLNGKRYRSMGSYEFPIEYGYYNLRLSINQYKDFNASFVINEDNPVYRVDYTPTEPACTFIIRGLYTENFMVSILSGDQEEIYYNRDILPLPLGDVKVQIHVSGYTMEREFHFDEVQEVSLNFEEEIKQELPALNDKSE